MFACLRSSRAPPAHIWPLRAFSVSSRAMAGPLFGVPNSAPAPAGPDEGRSSAIQGLAELVQSAAEQERDAAALPASLLERPKQIKPNTFSNPNHLTREHRISRIERRPKEATMGPGRKEAQATDVFRKLDIDPLNEYKNPLLLSHFVTEMGKIQSRAKTQLTWRSQRRVGKAIRRARALGILPLWNTHTVGYRLS